MNNEPTANWVGLNPFIFNILNSKRFSNYSIYYLWIDMIEYLIIMGILIIIGLIILAPKSRTQPHIRNRPTTPEDEWDKTMLEERAKSKTM